MLKHTYALKLKVNIVHVGVAELLFISLLTWVSAFVCVCVQGLCVLWTMSTKSFILAKDKGEFHISVSLIPSPALCFSESRRQWARCPRSSTSSPLIHINSQSTRLPLLLYSPIGPPSTLIPCGELLRNWLITFCCCFELRATRALPQTYPLAMPRVEIILGNSTQRNGAYYSIFILY